MGWFTKQKRVLDEDDRKYHVRRAREWASVSDHAAAVLDYEHTLHATEAKLDRAVGALREIKAMNCLQDDWKHIAISYWKIARDALEEIDDRVS